MLQIGHPLVKQRNELDGNVYILLELPLVALLSLGDFRRHDSGVVTTRKGVLLEGVLEDEPGCFRRTASGGQYNKHS